LFVPSQFGLRYFEYGNKQIVAFGAAQPAIRLSIHIGRKRSAHSSKTNAHVPAHLELAFSRAMFWATSSAGGALRIGAIGRAANHPG
jgi:hypothetical protein